MTHFNDIGNGTINARQKQYLNRIGRRDVLPTSVKSRFLPQDILKNSSVTEGSFSFNNGVTITITSRTKSTISDDVRVATVPFMIALFDSDTFSGINPETNEVPYKTTTGNFDVYGPIAAPDFTVNDKRFFLSSGDEVFFATNGNDVVWRTAIANNSGGNETIQYIIQTRVLQSRGGGV